MNKSKKIWKTKKNNKKERKKEREREENEEDSPQTVCLFSDNQFQYEANRFVHIQMFPLGFNLSQSVTELNALNSPSDHASITPY